MCVTHTRGNSCRAGVAHLFKKGAEITNGVHVHGTSCKQRCVTRTNVDVTVVTNSNRGDVRQRQGLERLAIAVEQTG